MRVKLWAFVLSQDRRSVMMKRQFDATKESKTKGTMHSYGVWAHVIARESRSHK